MRKVQMMILGAAFVAGCGTMDSWFHSDNGNTQAPLQVSPSIPATQGAVTVKDAGNGNGL